MKKESSTYGLSLKKVVELLSIGTDMCQIPDDKEQQKADLLSDRLNDTLPLYYSTDQEPSRKLKRLGQTIAALAGEPIGKLLQDPKTDISIIRMTKDHGRKLSTLAKSKAKRSGSEDERAGSMAEHDAANTIYFAAIAFALVYQEIKISNYSYKDLHQAFCQLSGQEWIPQNLCGLFKKACEFCEAKKSSSPNTYRHSRAMRNEGSQ
jgi:hypothetical protein